MSGLTLISVDDHLHEPPETFAPRLPERLRERGPRLEPRPEGDVWVFDGDEHPVHPLTASAGRPQAEWGTPAHYSEMRPAFYDPVARLADMDEDGVVASLCFPSFSGFSGTPFIRCAERDPELALLSLQAYNDFVCEEWAAAAPGRYIPLVLLPLWDQVASAAEVERTAAMGAKAIAFSENPFRQGLPSIHDADHTPLPLSLRSTTGRLYVTIMSLRVRPNSDLSRAVAADESMRVTSAASSRRR